MSYQFTATAPRDEINEALDKAQADAGLGAPGPEVTEQVTAALRAIDHLAGAVGRPDDVLAVSVAGHANPDHVPSEGESNDHVVVTVHALPAEEDPST